jgi:hypothetical protein
MACSLQLKNMPFFISLRRVVVMDRMRRDMWLTWRKMWRVGVIGCIVLLGTLYVFNFSGMAAFIVAQAQEVGTPTQTSAGDTFIPANPTELTSRQINAFPSIEEALTTTGPTPPPGISRVCLCLSRKAKVLEDVPAYLAAWLCPTHSWA